MGKRYTHAVAFAHENTAGLEGRIEIEYKFDDTGAGIVGEAYFRPDDLLADIGPEGDFTHPMTEREYRLLVPRGHTKSETATLLVRDWRTVGSVKPGTIPRG